MSLNEQTIILSEIQRNAHCVRFHAEAVDRYMRVLPATPPYETMAQDELDRAERALQSALARIEDAKAAYKRKPVRNMIAAE